MRALVAEAFFRHWWAFAVSGVVTAVVGLALVLPQPPVWRVEAEVVLTDQVAMARLANPAAPLERPDEDLQGIDHWLLSTTRLVAHAKDEGLVDQLELLRSPIERVEAWVLGLARGPLTEKERLEAVVELLRKRLRVERQGRRLLLVVEWSDRETALRLARAELDALLRGQVQLGLEASIDAAAATDERLAQAHRDNVERAQRMAATQDVAAGQQRRVVLAADEQAQRDGRVREEELLVRSRDQHLQLDVALRANAVRAVVLRAPVMPTEPSSATPAALVLLWMVVSLLSAVSGPLLVAVATAQRLHPRLVVVGLVLLATLSGVALATADGDWVAALTPLGWAVTVWAVWTLPLKWPLLALFLAVITCDDPTDRAYVGKWHSPLYGMGNALFTNVAWFTGFELRLLGLTGVMLVRQLVGATVDPVPGQGPRPLRLALLGSMATLALLVVLGLSRGGEFRHALWQFRFLMMLPVVSLLALHAFEFPKDLGKVFAVLLVGSLVKSAFGVYFMLAIVPTLTRFPPHTSGHNDTMLLVTAALVPLVLLWERPTLGRLGLLLLWVPLVALAIRYNDRRIAYVDLGACAAAIFLISPRHRVKRFVQRASVLAVPIVLLYLAVGWDRQGERGFRLAQTVRSLVAPVEGSKNESSNAERDIENYNMVTSWRGNAVFGQGFGHAFTEYARSNDFAQSNFGHVGHNSLLWLLWLGGIAGFSGVLAWVVVALFLLGRTLVRVTAVDERAALLVALGVLVTYLNQCFGDMGTQSIELVFFVALALAITGRLATRHGAWVDAPVTVPVVHSPEVTA